MPVYVDKYESPFGKMVMCHMFADTLDELHLMAERIGLKRAWFQGAKVPHYDICKSKRVLAIKEGALEIDVFQAAELIRKWRKVEWA
jgi:hypothetical protein